MLFPNCFQTPKQPKTRIIKVPPAPKTAWTLPPIISRTPVPMLTGLDIILDWPNYPLRLPPATSQLFRLQTSPASNVMSKTYLTRKNITHAGLAHAILSFVLTKFQHEFACVLACSCKISRCFRLSCQNSSRTVQENKTVSRNSKNLASSQSDIWATSALNFERSWQSHAMVIDVHTVIMDHYIILNRARNLMECCNASSISLSWSSGAVPFAFCCVWLSALELHRSWCLKNMFPPTFLPCIWILQQKVNRFQTFCQNVFQKLCQNRWKCCKSKGGKQSKHRRFTANAVFALRIWTLRTSQTPPSRFSKYSLSILGTWFF